MCVGLVVFEYCYGCVVFVDFIDIVFVLCIGICL